MDIEEISPELFTWELYEPDFGHRLGLYWNRYGETFQPDEFLTQLKKFIIGWCDPSRLAIRPKSDGAAVMCEDDDGKFWFHVLPETAGKLGIGKGERRASAKQPTNRKGVRKDGQ